MKTKRIESAAVVAASLVLGGVVLLMDWLLRG